jgi:hypothetical protein
MTPPFRLAFARSSASTYSEAVRLAKQSPVYQGLAVLWLVWLVL